MFPNVSHAFTAGFHFTLIWIVIMLIMVWSIGILRYEWSLYQGDTPSEARKLRKAWRMGALYVLALTGIAIFGCIVSGMLL